MKDKKKLKYGWDEKSEKIAEEFIKANQGYKSLIIKLKKARIALDNNKLITTEK